MDRPDDDNAPPFLTIGEVAGPFGLRGELKVSVITQFPERFASLTHAYLNESPFEIESCRFHKKMVILKFRGIDSIEEAEKLRGRLVEVLRSEAVSLTDDQYYHYQIVGLNVWTRDGQLIGKIEEILTLPANDVYLVRFNGKEILIPAIEDVVIEIDVDKGRLVIEPMAGMLD